VSSNRPEDDDDIIVPFTVWRQGNDADVREYNGSTAEEAARQRAHHDYKTVAFQDWPITYCARNNVTGQIWTVLVDVEMQPAFVACEAHEVPMPPAVHVLWGGNLLCENRQLRTLGAPGNWPKGQRWISLKDVADGAEAPPDRCEACWTKAPGLVAGLRQIGAHR
jgi:hypothetical protein